MVNIFARLIFHADNSLAKLNNISVKLRNNGLFQKILIGVVSLDIFINMQELNENENLLSNIERSWADCANGFRTGNRFKGNSTLMTRDLVTIHETLEVHQNAFIEGEQEHLLWALRLCLSENLPIPYWCSIEIIKRINQVTKEPCSLHDLFGLNTNYPAYGKKANNRRAKNIMERELYFYTRRYMLEHHVSKDVAISAIIKKYFPCRIQKRSARISFDKIEREQAPLRKAHGLNK